MQKICQSKTWYKTNTDHGIILSFVKIFLILYFWNNGDDDILYFCLKFIGNNN